MISFSGMLDGADQVRVQVEEVTPKIMDALAEGVGRGVARGEGIVKGNASGRPGPRVITGGHRGSISGDHAVQGDSVVGQIGANSAQAARLEYGFVGRDSLGRNYNQAPYPYFQPSVPEVTSAIVSEVESAVQGAL